MSYDVDTLGFGNLIEFLKNHEKKEEYKGLSGIRSRVLPGQKTSSTSQIPLNAKGERSPHSNVYAKIPDNGVRCGIYDSSGHSIQQYTKNAYIVVRPDMPAIYVGKIQRMRAKSVNITTNFEVEVGGTVSLRSFGSHK